MHADRCLILLVLSTAVGSTGCSRDNGSNGAPDAATDAPTAASSDSGGEATTVVGADSGHLDGAVLADSGRTASDARGDGAERRDSGSGGCNGCLIDSVCIPEGTLDPSNGCRICDRAKSAKAWSAAEGAPCDDGLFCNGADSCQSGRCAVHAGAPCGGLACDESRDLCDCPLTSRCIPTVPDGWKGPVVVSETGEKCPADAFPNSLFKAFGGALAAGPVACECKCDRARGQSCSQAQLVAYSDPRCLTAMISYRSFEACSMMGNDIWGTTPPTGGSCQATAAKVSSPEPVWEIPSVTICGAVANSPRCGEAGLCVPSAAAPFSSACIYQIGDVACEGPTYTDKRLYYQGHEDKRGCGACECGNPTGGYCGAKFTSWAGTDKSNCLSRGCAESLTGLSLCEEILIREPCFRKSADLVMSHIEFWLQTAGTCSPSTPSEPYGEVTAQKPLTLCCLP